MAYTGITIHADDNQGYPDIVVQTTRYNSGTHPFTTLKIKVEDTELTLSLNGGVDHVKRLSEAILMAMAQPGNEFHVKTSP